MIVNVKIYSGLGADLGPNFVVTTDVGTVSYNYTLVELLAGVQITVEDNATFVIITSLGVCTNSLYLAIGEEGTTTTTTTTLPSYTYYEGDIYDCECVQESFGEFRSLTALEVGKWYLSEPYNGTIVQITSIVTGPGPILEVNPIPYDTCEEVPCSESTTTTTTLVPLQNYIRMDYIDADTTIFSNIANDSLQSIFSFSPYGTSGNYYYIAFKLNNIGGAIVYPQTPIIMNDTTGGKININTITGVSSISFGQSYDTTVEINATSLSNGIYTCTFRQELIVSGYPSVFFDVNLRLQMGV